MSATDVAASRPDTDVDTLQVLHDAEPIASGLMSDPPESTSAYAASDLEAFSAAYELECARLEAAITEAREREARAHAQREHIDPQAELIALLASAQRELLAIEHEHREAIDAIRVAAAEEEQRIRLAARADARALRSAAESIDMLWRPDDD